MDVAWMSEFESGQQVFTCVDDGAPLNMLAAVWADLAERPGVQARRQRALYDRVAQAVHGEGLSIVLQPIIETRTGRLVGAEALARFAARESGPSASGPAAWF